MSKIISYKRAIESAAIIGTGLLMHLTQVSIIEMRQSKSEILIPNAASSLFVLSVLCICSKLRPILPRARQTRGQFLAFIVEACLIFYATDLILRQIWMPGLKLLNFGCHSMGEYIKVSNGHFLKIDTPRLANWVQNDGFYFGRFLLAIVTFGFMLDIVGAMELSFINVNSRRRPMTSPVTMNVNYNDNAGVNNNENSNGPMPTDVNEIDHNPTEELLDINPVRRRRQIYRNIRRRNIMLQNDITQDFTC